MCYRTYKKKLVRCGNIRKFAKVILTNNLFTLETNIQKAGSSRDEPALLLNAGSLEGKAIA